MCKVPVRPVLNTRILYPTFRKHLFFLFHSSSFARLRFLLSSINPHGCTQELTQKTVNRCNWTCKETFASRGIRMIASTIDDDHLIHAVPYRTYSVSFEALPLSELSKRKLKWNHNGNETSATYARFVSRLWNAANWSRGSRRNRIAGCVSLTQQKLQWLPV